MSALESEHEPRYMRAKDVAMYLGIGVYTVWKYVKAGKLKSKKISSRVTVFKKSDLDNFFDDMEDVA